MEPRVLGACIASMSDADQCVDGVGGVLIPARDRGEVVLYEPLRIRSIHYHTDEALAYILEMGEAGVDVAIVGAGAANHLTGTLSAYSLIKGRNDHMVVVGVAFENYKNPEDTEAAILSTSQVPRQQFVFSDGHGFFVGATGFTRACRFAVEGDLPKLTIPPPRPKLDFTWNQFYVEALAKREDRTRQLTEG